MTLASRDWRLRECLAHRGQRWLRLSRVINQAEGPVLNGAAAAPPFVCPGIYDRSAGALHESRPHVHRGDASLTLETLAHAVGARFCQQQGSRPRDVLQPREVSPQIRFTVQIDIEGADIEALELEVFGRGEIHVRQEAVGRGCLDAPIELTQESLDAMVAVPPHNPGRDLVAHGKHECRGIRSQTPHRVRSIVPDLSGQLWVVKERDVLWPCEPHNHSQPVS